MKKKKPIQPTASLETVRKRMADRKEGQRYSNPYMDPKFNEAPSGYNIIFDSDEWLQSLQKAKDREQRTATAKETDKIVAKEIETITTNLYNDMLAYYNSTLDVKKTMEKFKDVEQVLQQKVDMLSYTIEFSPYKKVVAKMCYQNPKFFEYLSDKDIEMTLPNILFKRDMLMQNNEYIYKRVGKGVLTYKGVGIYFPQVMDYLNADDTSVLLCNYPEMYPKISKSIHEDFLRLQDAEGKHVMLYKLIKNKLGIINYFSSDDLTIALKDFPPAVGRALNVYPQNIVKLKAGIFNIVKPSIVFQNVQKQNMIDSILASDKENNTNLYQQIIEKHPQLDAYFARFVKPSNTTYSV